MTEVEMIAAFEIIVLMVLVCCYHFWYQRRLRKRMEKLITPKSAEPKFQNYGHPWPPVPALRDHLPEAPSDHSWEIYVRHDENGEPFLHLTLINVVTGGPVAGTKMSLQYRSPRYLGTYAEAYREYGAIKKKFFYNDLLGPMMDWATTTVNRMVNSNTVSDYTIR